MKFDNSLNSEPSHKLSEGNQTTRRLFDIGFTIQFHNPNGTKINITRAILAHGSNIAQLQIDDAKRENVILNWATHYQSLLNDSSCNFVIGHDQLPAFDATNLKRNWKGPNSPKVALMVHRTPKTEKGLIDKELFCNWMKGTDVVFSIGETESKKLKRFVYGEVTPRIHSFVSH